MMVGISPVFSTEALAPSCTKRCHVFLPDPCIFGQLRWKGRKHDGLCRRQIYRQGELRQLRLFRMQQLSNSDDLN